MPGNHGAYTENIVHGGDVYRNNVRLDFSVSLNPLDMPEEIRNAMLEGISEAGQYPDPLQQRLREEVALLEGVCPDEVICGNGASELLMAAVHAFMPKKALLTAPCYAGYSKALEAVSAAVEEYELKEEGDFALRPDFVDRIDDFTDMVFISDPNNPDGRRIDPLLKRRIIERCEETGAILVIDECFLPLSASGTEIISNTETGTLTLTDDTDEAVSGTALHLRAFTKTFAIPGIRLGYMISRDQSKTERIRKQLPEWNVSRIAERTGEAAAKLLRETDYLERSMKTVTEERKYLTGELTSLGIKVYPSDANYILIKSSPELYDELLKRGILIRSCSNFSGLDDTFFRIAVRRHEDNIFLAKALKTAVGVTRV